MHRILEEAPVSEEFIQAVNCSRGSSKQTWERMEGESAKAFAAFCRFRDLGPDRTLRKVAEKLRKSEQLMQRWGKKFNWHGRAVDFDEYSDSELQRKLLAHRIRVRQRALDIADKIDQKLVEAVDALKVTKLVKAEGKPDEMQLQVSPAEIARLFEVSQKVQSTILGDASEDRVAEIHVNFSAYLPEYDYEQPEQVQARRKAELEARQAPAD
jgi:hypothetical protein